jgi:hypothetical protein
MKKLHCLSLSVALTLAAASLAPQLALGQVTGPSGDISVNVPGSPIWDLSGDKDVQFGLTNKNTQVVVSYQIHIDQNGGGKLVGGPATTSVSLNVNGVDSPFDGRYKATGSVSSTRTGTRISLHAAVSGRAEIPGHKNQLSPHHVVAVKSVSFSFAPGDDSATETERDSASASGLGSIGGHQSLSIPLSELLAGAGDGSWTLSLTGLTTTGHRVSGGATVTLSSGLALSFVVHGAFRPDGHSHLTLVPADRGTRGSSLRVTLDGNNGNAITDIKGRLTGQKVDVTL